MSFAKLPLDFIIPADKVLAGQTSLLVLYRDRQCPDPEAPLSPRVVRVLDHGEREVAPGTWAVTELGNQELEWRPLVVTYCGGELAQQAGQDAVLLFAGFFEQTTIEIELCMAGHEECEDDECERRDSLILKLGVRPA
jgi:hypothetical protein